MKKRKKDASSEISLLYTFFPEITTGTATKITGRDTSLCSRMIKAIKKTKQLHRDISNFNEDDGRLMVQILKELGYSVLEIAYVTELSINDITEWYGEDALVYTLKKCPKGHEYFARFGEKSCKICQLESTLSEAKRVNKSEFTEKEKENFTSLFYDLKNVIKKYYMYRKYNATLKYIKNFRDALLWVKEGDVIIGKYNVPFDSGCVSIGLNPYLEREKIFYEVKKMEGRVADAKDRNRVYKSNDILDVFCFVNGYITEFGTGRHNRGEIYKHKPLSNGRPFFKALWT